MNVAVYRGEKGKNGKDFSHFADLSLMSEGVHSSDDYTKQRSAFRISMNAGQPVYLLLTLEGMAIDPIVDELGGGGARLVSARHYDLFEVGQMIGPAVLVLEDEGMPVVYPRVKWKDWPIIGVEFVDISEKEREMIMRFLFKIERQRVQQRPTAIPRRRPS